MTGRVVDISLCAFIQQLSYSYIWVETVLEIILTERIQYKPLKKSFDVYQSSPAIIKMHRLQESDVTLYFPATTHSIQSGMYSQFEVES